MGKKKRQVSYDKEALNLLIKQMNYSRKAIRGELKKLEIDPARLETVISCMLPKEDKEAIEKLFGLVPGTICHVQMHWKKKNSDKAYQEMLRKGLLAVERMMTAEYLMVYDKNVYHLCKNIISRVDRSGYESMPDVSIIKYIKMMLIFFVGGPKLFYESDTQEIDKKVDQMGKFDDYALLEDTWRISCKDLPENGISLKLLIETLSNFDWVDIQQMKAFVGLSYDKDVEVKTFYNFGDIRKFKEKVFPYGEWSATLGMIYYAKAEEMRFPEFVEIFNEFREDWGNLDKYKSEEIEIITSEGTKKVPTYQIAGIGFSDPYEIMCLYLARNCIQQ